MLKDIYILTEVEREWYADFRTRMLESAEELDRDCHPYSLKITLTTRKPPVLSIIPFSRKKVAVISVTGAGAALRGKVSATEGFLGGYQVEEAVPVAYEKNWDDRVPTPGVCLLTFFHRKPGIDQDQFITRWHEGHTPLSLRLHPLWNYNRNVVTGTLTDDSPWYDGIVEEQVRSARDLLNPFRFFGPPLKLPRHMMEVWKDTRSFIHMKRIETYLATEYHIRS